MPSDVVISPIRTGLYFEVKTVILIITIASIILAKNQCAISEKLSEAAKLNF